MSSTTLSIIAFVLFILVVFQLARTSEYVAVLRGKEKSEEETDKANAWMFLIFMILGLSAMFWSVYHYKDLMIRHSVSVHGQWLDSMFNVTLFFTGTVFLATQIMLFYFVWKYKHVKGRKAKYYPENNKLEMWWTVIPAIVLTTLVVIGIYRWFQITGPEPADSNVVEITGQQFLWNYRYGGADGKLGDYNFNYISGVNKVGVDFNDPASKDDFLATEMHCVVNKPVLLRIRSKDVIHDVGIPWFRVKMDAVPGLVTRFWFIPTKTTAQMRTEMNNPDFNFDIACDQLCGTGHYGMKGLVIVETQEEFDAWMKKQPSFYESAVKGTDEEKWFASQTIKVKSEAKKPAAHEAGKKE
ncbi:MAG: cytochrome c oxidase subunit II [Chitinophagales bacterium]|nr:cytochrome c oxidase subunit II [Chitinophagales bacterium]